jgi:hypothetical protein
VLDEQMGSCDNVALNARACQYAQHSASSALAIVTISKGRARRNFKNQGF